MSWFADSMINRPPFSSEFGLIVRPIFSGSDPGVLTVQLASGSLSIGAISGSFTQPQPNVGNLYAVPVSTTAVIIVSGNLDRMGLTIFNDSTGSLMIRLGVGVTPVLFTVRLTSQDYYELPFPVYTGDVWGIWNDAGPGNALSTELVP